MKRAEERRSILYVSLLRNSSLNAGGDANAARDPDASRVSDVTTASVSNRMPWTSIGAVVVGAFMVSLDQTVVSLALPRIGDDLNATTGVDWVVSAYLLALGVCQPTAGWLADRFGRKRIFLASLFVFTVGAVLGGVAADLPQLVGARIVQGLGGSAIFPVGMAMIYEQVPPSRRGSAVGMFSLGMATAPAVGPSLGGLIITEASWRWLFLIMVPICLVALLVGWRVLPATGYRAPRRFDAIGFGLVTVGLTAVLYAFEEGNAGGFGAASTLGLLTVGVLLVALFVVHELRVPAPLIDVRMFAIPGYNVAIALTGGMIAITFARLVFLPLELVGVRGLSALDVGILLTPAAFTQAVGAPLGGFMADRIGARLPVFLGVAAMGIASLGFANLAPDTPTLLIATFVGVQGFGFGLALTPNAVAGMNSLPQRLLAAGTAVRSTVRQVSGSFAIAIFTAFLVSRIGSLDPPTSPAGALAQQAGYNALFLGATGLAIVCLALAALAVADAAEMAARVAARTEERDRAATGD